MILYLIVQNHNWCIFDTLKYGHMKDILLGQNALNVTKSYTYLGQIITDNVCDEPDIKAIPLWQKQYPAENVLILF